jgi:hypothetical protein
VERTVKRCELRLRERLAQVERDGSIPTLESLKTQRAEAERQVNTLLDFIVQGGGGDITSLTNRLRAAEAEVSRLDAEIAAHRCIKPAVAIGAVRQEVLKCLTGLRETVRDRDVTRGKDAIAKYVGKLVLTPVQRNGRRMYRVSGHGGPESRAAGALRFRFRFLLQARAIQNRHLPILNPD